MFLSWDDLHPGCNGPRYTIINYNILMAPFISRVFYGYWTGSTQLSRERQAPSDNRCWLAKCRITIQLSILSSPWDTLICHAK